MQTGKKEAQVCPGLAQQSRFKGAFFTASGRSYHQKGFCPTYVFVYIHDTSYSEQSNIWAQNCYQRLLGPALTVLHEMLQQHNLYVQSILTLHKRTFGERGPDDYNTVIHADKKPAAERDRKYNGPTSSEDAIIAPGQEEWAVKGRDIIIQQHAGLSNRGNNIL